ncbi:MFS general substrate transporter [Aaosphaeria arxii CBS 175.79]|uniref:MFS general substrate transporter n=1 Tax=Aaosphaeria arxii CBS 175.79 TaxID=1450172 RepID=A0A6A5Y6A4_9PLEO|nr:MFS general substrate transporter [Aaosphaeria arxii CBS 175.79]KAF2020826.1 MFS general substrate transporter [Aaosphaeria arxii CBS 175.79]
MARHRGANTLLRDNTPFPTRQMAILALCRICEPIAFMSIFPYVYYMVGDFGIAHDEAQISVYAGMVTSAFAFAECASGVFWGRLSDRVGRKKVLLGGLFGTGLSMLLFGFAQNLPMALVARALGGLLNGNIGVLQTTVAELVTVEKHQPRAYSIMPFIWCLGTIIGASLGGILARPAISFPDTFAGTLFETYPYLLPNLVCAAVVIFGLTVGILFLEETHEDKKFEKDRGLEIGQWLLRKVWSKGTYTALTDKDASIDEMQAMLEGPGSPTYQSTSSSPTLCSSRSSIAEPPPFTLEKGSESSTVRSAFTKQVCLNIVGVGLLAFHTISLEQLIPILMSHPESTKKPELPFKFEGGFGFSTQKIGSILAVQGVLQMIAQVVVFPWVNKRIGSLRTFWITIATYPFLYVMAPYLALLPKPLRIPGIFVLLVWKVTAQSMSYPSLNMMLANAAPSKKVLGTLNGAAASSASVCRGFGPTIAGAVDSIGAGMGVSGLAWWVCAGVAATAWIPGAFMKEERRRPGFCNVDDVDDEELGLREALDDTDSDVDSIMTLTPEEDTVNSVLSK